MNLVIDNLDTVTGWLANGDATIHGLNAHDQYIAGDNDNSIVFSFDSLSDYVEKTYGTDISDYDEFVVHIWSQQKQSNVHNKISDFSYKIDLGTGKEYYLPTWSGFSSVVIDISDINTIDRIRVTSLHSDSDYIVMSYAIVAKDELPLDIFNGMKSGMEAYRDSIDSYLLGTVTTLSGATTIDLSNFNFINDYAIIKIDDGNNNEIHQLRRHNEGVFNFTELYDGESLINAYSDASVYLYFPIEFGRDSLEAIIPGITVWGFEPEKIDRTFDIQNVTDTWTALGASERKEGHYLKWPLLIQCEARQDEILAHLAKIARIFIGKKIVYVNGRKLTINFEGVPTETRPIKDIDIIPMITYRGVIELREELWERTSLVKTTTINSPVEIQ